MLGRKIALLILAQLLIGASARVIGASFLIAPAHVQFGVSVPNPPTQMSSSPSAVPQPSYAPFSPTRPGRAPGYAVRPPVNATGAQGPTTLAAPPASNRRARPMVATPMPVGHSYGCAWQRSADGFWSRTTPCS
jgi:hypothetical protein